MFDIFTHLALYYPLTLSTYRKKLTPSNKTKILVVEDESIVARDIRNMLIGLGYEVVGVTPSATESVKLAQTKKPHLVLMDIMLQGKTNGVGAADQIYSQYNIPIVYLTAYADETTLQKAKKAEPFGYLLKPFEERELQTTIEIALYKFKMEMKLKDRERWLSTILKSVGDAVIAANEKGHITFMNPLAENLTGWKNPENIPKPLNEIFRAVRKNTKKEISIPLEKILRGEKYRFPREAILLSRKGDKIPIFQSATPIKNEDKSITGVVLSFSDITRLKKAEEELKNSLTRLKNVMEGTVEAMAYTIETRDPYTAGHQRRVAKLASAIAQMMDLPDDQIEGIHMAGTLHDIGKIHVPAEILNKPGKISDAEYNIIKTHSQVGFDILKSIDFPWPIAEIVLQHHERLDGSGYPQGIRKNEILQEAKILAVADTVEALATHRPYRPAFTRETALNEIKTYRGILYDKHIVDVCLKIFDTGFNFD